MGKKRNMDKGDLILLIVLVLLFGIFLGVRGDRFVRAQIAKQNKPTYEIVMGPTRDTVIRYTKVKGEVHEFPNPSQKLCVVVFNRTSKPNYYELRELQTPAWLK
ncbi:hypothetical protein ACFQHW_07040 [Lapidilactobacillus achengensis]|uniref:Extracellular protein n=1 Tax=Lapidilactobacillus achengensis TaxID=2486000 RepID=A0ABW1UMW1_9LACO|nr:hypothetical protein [Lapidilactobacillus achengensis]